MRFLRPAATAVVVTLGLGLLGVPARAAAEGRIDTGGPAANLRAGPGTQYPITGNAADGQTVAIVCTTDSETVTTKNGTSSTWDKLGAGSWVTGAYVRTDGGVQPECPPTGARPTEDDYPYRGTPNAVDRWAMYSGQCTSWVAWRMEQLNGYFHNHMWRKGIQGRWGNAHEWDENAVKLGYPVDRTPQVGAIAQWEPNAGGAGEFGHVAYISAVNGTEVTVQEYNWATAAAYSTRTVQSADISNIIHFVPGT